MTVVSACGAQNLESGIRIPEWGLVWWRFAALEIDCRQRRPGSGLVNEVIDGTDSKTVLILVDAAWGGLATISRVKMMGNLYFPL